MNGHISQKKIKTQGFVEKFRITKVINETEMVFHGTCNIEKPKDNCIAYAKNLKFIKKFQQNGKKCAIIIPEELELDREFQEISKGIKSELTSFFVTRDNVLQVFLDTHDFFYAHRLKGGQCFKNLKPFNKELSIFVGENTQIDPTATICANTTIGSHCKIGKDTVIYPGTQIYDYTIIGDGCIIHSNCSIGTDGFRFVPMEDGTQRKMIHVSNVIIEDEVEIQSNCNVSRGTFDPTIIKRGTKVDALVHIAHNDIIGKNNIITATVCFSGSVELGDNCWIGINSSISNGIKIASNNEILMGAVVGWDVPETGQRLSGFYATKHKKWKSWWKNQFK